MSRSPIVSRDPLSHPVAELGQVEAVATAVEHALGVVHLAVAEQVDDGLYAHQWSPSRRRGDGGCRQGIEDRRDGPVVVGRGHEPRLVRRRRAGRRPGRASSGRTRRRPRCPAGSPRRSRATAPSRKKTENIVPAVWTTWGTDAARRASDAALRIVGRGLVEAGVDLGRREAQGGEPGRRGDRVPRERAGLVDGPLGRQVRHDVGAAAEGRRREAAAHHLAEGHQVGSPALDRRRRGPSRPRAVARKPVITSSLMKSAPWARQVSARKALKPGIGGTTPMLPGAASVMRQAMRGAVGGEGGLDGVAVVVGQDDRLARGRGRDAAGAGDGQRRDAGARLGEQRVDVAVVAAGELHDEVATGEAARQPDRRHGRLGAARRRSGPARPAYARRSPRPARPRARSGCRTTSRGRPLRPPRPARRGARGRAASDPTSRSGRRSRCRRRR